MLGVAEGRCFEARETVVAENKNSDRGKALRHSGWG
jgi:hypothetical protein